MLKFTFFSGGGLLAAGAIALAKQAYLSKLIPLSWLLIGGFVFLLLSLLVWGLWVKTAPSPIPPVLLGVLAFALALLGAIS